MPENFVQISFEVFRTFKRTSISFYEKEEEQFALFKKEYEEIYFNQELKGTSFPFELAKYISRHFFDPKIANPDQKERYLTRLNIMLQYDQYIRLLERYD